MSPNQSNEMPRLSGAVNYEQYVVLRLCTALIIYALAIFEPTTFSIALGSNV